MGIQLCNWIAFFTSTTLHPRTYAQTHIDEHNNHGTDIGRQRKLTAILTPQHTESFTNTITDTAMAQSQHPAPHHTHNTTHMANPRVGDCCDARPPPSDWISPLCCHCPILTCLGLLLLLLVGSVAVGPNSRCSVDSLLMADMVNGSFFDQFDSLLCLQNY